MQPDFDWTDNICTVGWTCIDGTFASNRMREILKECPKGHFLQTGLYQYKTISTPEEAEEYIEWFNKQHSYYHMQTVRFYFDFPLDDKGVEFLRKYGFDPTKARFWNRRKDCKCRS